MRKVYTNIEKLEYYRKKLVDINNKIAELVDLVQSDPEGITFQNWDANSELIKLAKALAHGEQIEKNYAKKEEKEKT